MKKQKIELTGWQKEKQDRLIQSRKEAKQRRENILKHNEPKFLEDLKRVRTVCAYTTKTNSFFAVLKCDVLRTAERKEIRYFLTHDIYVNGREVMAII